MITAIKSPSNGAVFLSANSIFIEVSSDLDIDHYFKAEILVDNEIFLDFTIGKYNTTSAKLDLKNIFENCFENDFFEFQENGLQNLNHLLKTINITIYEIGVLDETVISSLSIPEFYVIYSSAEMYFNPTIDLQKISTYKSDLTIVSNGKVQFPIWTLGNTITLDILYEGASVYNEQFTGLEKGIYNFYYDFSSLSYDFDYVILQFKSNSQIFSQKINFKKLKLYQTESLYIQNQFLCFEYIELFGRSQVNIPFKRTTITDYESETHVIDVEKKYRVKIFSHPLLPNENKLIETINDCEVIYYLKDNEYKKFFPISKKVNGLDTGLYYYEQSIELEQSKSNPIKEDDFNYD